MSKNLSFDFNNMFEEAIGSEHGITKEELKKWKPEAKKALDHIKEVIKNKENRIKIGLEWMELGNQDEGVIKKTIETAEKNSEKFQKCYFSGYRRLLSRIKSSSGCPSSSILQ